MCSKSKISPPNPKLSKIFLKFPNSSSNSTRIVFLLLTWEAYPKEPPYLSNERILKSTRTIMLHLRETWVHLKKTRISMSSSSSMITSMLMNAGSKWSFATYLWASRPKTVPMLSWETESQQKSRSGRSIKTATQKWRKLPSSRIRWLNCMS